MKTREYYKTEVNYEELIDFTRKGINNITLEEINYFLDKFWDNRFLRTKLEELKVLKMQLSILGEVKDLFDN